VPVDARAIPLADDSQTHVVEVVLGKDVKAQIRSAAG
jgi:hypothetical protein